MKSEAKKIKKFINLLKKNKKERQKLNSEEMNLTKAYQKVLVKKIIDDGLLQKVKWSVEVPYETEAAINCIFGNVHDPVWKEISKILKECDDVSWGNHTIHLTNFISLQVNDSSLYIQYSHSRSSNEQRETFPEMNNKLLDFIKENKFTVDFSKVESQHSKLLETIKELDRVLEIGKEINGKP